jgi:nitroimidazol reductase NimA-like FMN-containing flavoprotein (pyridoxamine 5'-phosphate oxidase superfamily)
MSIDNQNRENSKTRGRRHPERGVDDQVSIEAIPDEEFLCHVGDESGNGPGVIPKLHGRHGDFVYYHGSPAAGMFRHARPDVDVCLAATLVDGFVLVRSLFHHLMNYRSVVLFGRAEQMADPDEVMIGLEAITENVTLGRWSEARLPNEIELRQMTEFRVELSQASAKIRSGPPGDEEEDISLDVWAGVIPVATRIGEPVPAQNLEPGMRHTVVIEKLSRD